MEKFKETKEDGRWIPVAEGMPQKNCLYLITYENASGRHSDAAFYDPDPGAWFWDEEETQKRGDAEGTKKNPGLEASPGPIPAGTVNEKDLPRGHGTNPVINISRTQYKAFKGGMSRHGNENKQAGD